jgi:glycosyltransferase involved in cell wall biosynthesis
MQRHLHIVTHDVPWPADYGGVIDLFYKIKELHSNGIQIHLHCFTNKKRQAQDELKKYCATIDYYPRKKNIFSFSFSIPFIVKSRRNKELLNNLLKDNYPILLEGIHCTYFLFKGKLKNRQIQIRLHNVEYEYYKYLAKHEKNIFKKIYFNYESWLLKKYEAGITINNSFLAVSKADELIYKNDFNAKQINYLPVFLPWKKSNNKEGSGNFCLYHGNLSVNENEKAVKWLLQNVFNDLKKPFVIAGKNPSKKLIKLVQLHQHICLVANPSNEEMLDLIEKAQINILPSFNNTGIKLKLLFAVFNGRHCIANATGVAGSGLETLCAIADDAATYKKLILQLYDAPFTNEDCKARQGILQNLYNNEKSAQEIIKIYWP